MIPVGFDARVFGRVGGPGGDDRVDMRIHMRERGVVSDIGQAAELPIERTFLGEDVARRAAVDDADMDGGERRIEAPARIARGLQAHRRGGKAR